MLLGLNNKGANWNIEKRKGPYKKPARNSQLRQQPSSNQLRWEDIQGQERIA
jgi:hypothetical protein